MRLRPARVPGRGDLARFVRQLRGPGRRSAMRSVLDAVVVTWTLKRRGVRPLLGASRPPAPTTVDAGPDAPGRARAVAAAVDAGMGLLPLAPTCLRRSLTLLRELDRVGPPGTLHIGVRGAGAAMGAHAWVQVGDDVVNDDPELTATYTELAAGRLESLLPMLR